MSLYFAFRKSNWRFGKEVPRHSVPAEGGCTEKQAGKRVVHFLCQERDPNVRQEEKYEKQPYDYRYAAAGIPSRNGLRRHYLHLPERFRGVLARSRMRRATMPGALSSGGVPV